MVNEIHRISRKNIRRGNLIARLEPVDHKFAIVIHRIEPDKGGVVIPIDDRGTAKCTEELGDPVWQHAVTGEPAPDVEREGDRGI